MWQSQAPGGACRNGDEDLFSIVMALTFLSDPLFRAACLVHSHTPRRDLAERCPRHKIGPAAVVNVTFERSRCITNVHMRSHLRGQSGQPHIAALRHTQRGARNLPLTGH